MRTLSPLRLHFSWDAQAADVATHFDTTHTVPAVVLIGPAGCGKSAIGGLVTEMLADRFDIVNVRGVTFGTENAYFALAHLITGPLQETDSPVAVLRRLDDSLRARTTGRPVLVYVQNFDLLDPQSAAVLATLMGAGEHASLITCHEVEAQPSLMGPIAAGLIEPIEVAPLGTRVVLGALENALGGTVPFPVAERLNRAAGGNPTRLRVLVEQTLSVDALTNRDGVWVLGRDGVPETSVHGTGVPLTSVYELLSEPEREAADLLAVFDRIPAPLMIELVECDALTSLEKAGVVTSGGNPLAFQLVTSAITAAFAEVLAPERFRSIWNTFRDRVRAAAGAFEPTAVMRATRAGIRVEPADTFAAARAATGHLMPRVSELMLDQLEPGYPGALQVRADNARQRGDLAAAEAFALEEQRTAISVEARANTFAFLFIIALEDRMDLELSESRLSAMDDWVLGEAQSSTYARGLALLCRLVMCAQRGNWREIIELSQGPDFLVGHADVRTVNAMFVAEALCTTGRQVEGIALARRVFAESMTMQPHQLRGASIMAMWRIHLLRGEWFECQQLAREHRNRYPERTDHSVAMEELADAYIVLLQGRNERAERPTRAARGLFAHLDGAAGSRVGEVFGPAVPNGASGAAPEDAAAEEGGELPRPIRFIGQVLISREHYDRVPLADAVAGHIRVADEFHLRGEYGFELFAIANLLRVLLRQDAHVLVRERDLVQRARRVIRRALTHNDGPLASVCAAFSAALAKDGPAAASTGLRLGEALGLGGFILREDSAGAPETRASEGSSSEPDGLSERERTVFIALRDGLRNREIGMRLGISARTAEGYVQRLYRRLGVRSRTELFALYPPSEGALPIDLFGGVGADPEMPTGAGSVTPIRPERTG
ncbi:LuxR family transcriptional regulator [Mycetocola tolaasinivorans]|uniref:LuxR family transcriptional regulator n=1 Tax=Mycetocola tolaasinivorans TaxID=76635 RepID=A0A3L7AC97_9MICO|nr:LuxR C-terminal-related transcriptional regulator [Mycetocola tolaasinivorans]RLP77012.1 LuxR family transcriptional regulator [Mycetocola tolaasinivorans]